MRKTNRYSLNIIFYACYILYFIPRYLEYTTLANIEQYEATFSMLKNISYVGIIIFIILSTLKKSIIVGKRELIFNAMVIAVIFYQMLSYSLYAVFVVLLLGIAYSRIKFSNKFNVFLYITFLLNIFMFVLVLMLNRFGVIPSATTSVMRFGIFLQRTALGFNYPGQLQMSFMTIAMLSVCCIKSKRRSVNIALKILLSILSIVIYMSSQTLIPLVMTLIIIIFGTIKGDEIVHFSKRSYHFLSHLGTFCFLIAFVLVLLWKSGPNIIKTFDALFLNYRLSLTNTAIIKYGITLLGTGFRNINEGGPTGEYLYVDSEYMNMLVSSGIIFTLLMLILIKYVMRWYLQNGTRKYIVLFSIILINAIANNGIFNLLFNPLMIVVFEAIKEQTRGQRSSWKKYNFNAIND